MKQCLVCFSLLTALLAGLAPIGARAQLDPRAVALHTGGQPGTDGFELSVLFAMLDGSGRPLPKDAVRGFQSAQIQLPTTAAVDATIEEATMPIKVALVIDASGSMVRRIDPVKEAAVKFVKAAPANAHIAVYKFSEEFELVQSFTGRDGIAALESSIRAIETRAPNTGDTCMYKAGFEAINALEAAKNASAQERQTVVLFTDGIDRENGGQNCGSAVEGDVINKAQAVRPLPVQVHTIGLCAPTDCGNINTAGLKALAEQTFGATAVGKVEELDRMFSTIVSALNNQWVAKATIRPVEGVNTATVRLNATVNDTPVNLSFPSNEFTSDRDYGTPPVRVEIAGLYQDTSKEEYQVKLNVSAPQAVKSISWKVRDESTNTTLFENTVDVIETSTVLAHPFAALKEGQRFCADIKAVDTNGAEIPDAEGKTTLVICGQHAIDRPPLDFDFALPPAFDWETGTFEIKLHKVQSADDVTLLYEGAITEGNLPVMQIPQGALGSDFTIKVPLEGRALEALRQSQAPKEYTIDLTLTDQVSNLQQNRQRTTTVVPPAQLTWLQRLTVALSTPLVLAAIVGIVVLIAAVVGVIALRGRRQTPGTPQPLYNGQTTMGTASSKPKPSSAAKPATSAEAATPPPAPEHGPVKPMPPIAPVVSRAAPKPVAVAPVAVQTEIGPSEMPAHLPPEIKINVVATLEPELNRGGVVRHFPCVIGRENSAFLIQGDKKVSRQHVELAMDGSRITIKDLGSANGTSLVQAVPGGATAVFTETLRVPKGGSVEWDGHSLIRLGPNTVLELKPQGASNHLGARTVMLDDLDNHTQMIG